MRFSYRLAIAIPVLAGLMVAIGCDQKPASPTLAGKSDKDAPIAVAMGVYNVRAPERPRT